MTFNIMPSRVHMILFLTFLLLPSISPAGDPPRLRRAESFLGIHFDFHAGPDCHEVGKNTTPAMVENIISLVKPDYLQIDCKGHPGYTSYPTKVGNPVPGFVGDPLRVWRETTAKHGVALYMHYSGVFDIHAVKTHPEWAAVNAEGKPSESMTSTFGPYVDRLLIPQLRELAGVYGVDGVWIDGDCWGAMPDYSAAALKAFREQTGFDSVPRGPSDPHWFAFLQFHREAYRQYLRHLTAAVKATHPTFQICSNWAFTDHMPEPVSAPLDFLSGDFSPQDSVNSARLSGRYLARQGVPWDLMAWSFTTAPERKQKPAVQLKREAAVILALGGGFQAYFSQKRDGSIHDEQMPVMAEVAQFCRERQAFTHHAQAVPQVAVLFSTPGHYRSINGLFSRNPAPIQGTINALIENQLSVELLGEHHLAARLNQYPLIVLPDWGYLEPAFREDLLTYVRDGGQLLLVGVNAAGLFAKELDINIDPNAPEGPIHLGHGEGVATLPGKARPVALGPGAKALGALHESADAQSPARPAASIASLGKGRIAAVYAPMGTAYAADPNPVARDFLGSLARELFPDPAVTVKGSNHVDITLAQKEGRRLVHLVNTSGPHRTQSIQESIPPIGPLEVTLRLPSKPSKVTLQPGDRPLPFDYENGQARLTVPGVAIMDTIVVDP